MSDKQAWDKVAGRLASEDFYRRDHQLTFRAITGLAAEGKPLDIITLSETLKRLGWLEECGGLAYLSGLAKDTPCANVVAWAQIVKAHATRRKILAMCGDITARAMDPGEQSIPDMLTWAETYLRRVADGASASASPTYKLLTVDDLGRLPPTRWRVKGVLPDKGLAAIYGPSGSGKPFLALDMAGAITAGREWFGHRVNPAPVVYLCLEGEAGLANRVAAYRTAHGGDSLRGVHFIAERFDILNGGPGHLVDTIRAAGLINPVIVIDTLARSAPGADENSGVDMGRIIDSAHNIQRETEGVVLLVHHTGKDSTRGMRGHTNLPAALDSIVEVKRDGPNREWSLVLCHPSNVG